MDGKRSKLCTCAKQLVWSVALTMLVSCSVIDPATLEGRWAIDDIATTSESIVLNLAATATATLVRGSTIEFRNGRVLIPVARVDTVWFDYRIRSRQLELLTASERVVARFEIVDLSHSVLRLRYGDVLLVLNRQP